MVDLRINETLQTGAVRIECGAVSNRTYRAWGKYRITELFSETSLSLRPTALHS